jgi:hypothetical protein
MVNSELPATIKELFDNKEASYCMYQSYDEYGMGNIESMEWFLGYIEGLQDEHIEENEGTQVVLTHPDYDYKLCIDSGGLGDFHSHVFDVSIMEDEK